MPATTASIRSNRCTTIQPARLKPGVSRRSRPRPRLSRRRGAASTAIIRGRALIFWDLKVPGKKKKLDAIDTDQITPAADCVSESLDTLDERWKAGVVPLPDARFPRARAPRRDVRHRRRSVRDRIVARDEPGRAQGVAEEVGLEMVIVCGHNMGDIFRRNALNLGLQVVQSPEAVADARDGDEFSFDPQSRRLTNETQGKTYEPVPLTPKEDEIRRTGGIFAVGRREFRRVGRRPRRASSGPIRAARAA